MALGRTPTAGIAGMPMVRGYFERIGLYPLKVLVPYSNCIWLISDLPELKLKSHSPSPNLPARQTQPLPPHHQVRPPHH